jgi:hypothetical protein
MLLESNSIELFGDKCQPEFIGIHPSSVIDPFCVEVEGRGKFHQIPTNTHPSASTLRSSSGCFGSFSS